MAINYPASKDDITSLPNPTGSSTQASPDHASLHTLENAAIIAIESKLGTGATTPTANTLLLGTGTGTSAWGTVTSSQLASALSDETGTGSAVFATTPTLITPKVDTINESTLNNGVTVAGMNIKSGFTSGANLTAGTVGSSQLATGVCVQQVTSATSAVATGTTQIPFDDTIPQSTEGDQYMTVSITPKASTNTLIIEAVFFGANSGAGSDIALAFFQDSTANALAATSVTAPGANYRVMIPLSHSMTAGTTSSTTFKLRAGPTSAQTVTFNGAAGGRNFGAITHSFLKVTEYKV